MNQIYTKTGDEGTTSLREGMRVSKDDPRIEANGQIDQLNALLGIVRSMLDDDESKQLIHAVQRELMTVMSHIATPDGHDNPRKLHCVEITAQLEQAIDAVNFQGDLLSREVARRWPHSSTWRAPRLALLSVACGRSTVSTHWMPRSW